jgi:hypothetical protein
MASSTHSSASRRDETRLATQPLAQQSQVNMTDAFDAERFPDNFYRGMIMRLDRARGRGVVRTNQGREVVFQFPFVEVAGAPPGGRFPGIDLLHEGDGIGFDLGWTSKGLRVTVIKPAHAPANEQP